jgi:hypothetical protein
LTSLISIRSKHPFEECAVTNLQNIVASRAKEEKEGRGGFELCPIRCASTLPDEARLIN